VSPGPLILKKHPDIFWGVVTSMYVGNFLLLALNIPLIGLFINILRIPYSILSPLIAVVCFVGAFSVNNNATDVVVMVFFGVVGYLMRKFEYDAAPLLLAYVLGPMLERSLRQALIISDGSVAFFFQRPISAALLAVALISLATPLWKWVANQYKSG